MTTLDDLNYFWMDNGAPCFVADRDNICDIVENLGFQIYYLIGNKAIVSTYTRTVNNVKTDYTETDYNASILKVVNNFMGRVVMDSPDPLPKSYSSVEETCEYNMPDLPRDIINKLDEFFRLVHAQHGTESIVLLTFDPSKSDSSGWGVLVPEQTNTSVHCKYDAESIAEIKPEHVIIVGSVHSHPEMSAYASGTDHEDQADFDGLHITYGWQKSVDNGKTKYHIEFQIGGSAYILKEDAVFEPLVEVNKADPEVVEWTTKVKKALPPTGGSATQVAQTGTPQTTPHLQTAHQKSQITSVGMNDNPYIDFKKKLSTLEDNSIVAVEVDFTNSTSVDCPVCTFPVFPKDAKESFCPNCDACLVTAEMNQGEVLFAITQYAIFRDLDLFSGFYLYCMDTTADYLINIKKSGDNPYHFIDQEELKAIQNDPSETSYYARAKTLCCGVLEKDAKEMCSCDTTVLEDDLYDFDIAHRSTDIYDRDSACYQCLNYYQPTCPTYSEAVVNFIANNQMIESVIQPCNSFVDYDNTIQTYDEEYVLTESYQYDRD